MCQFAIQKCRVRVYVLERVYAWVCAIKAHDRPGFLALYFIPFSVLHLCTHPASSMDAVI